MKNLDFDLVASLGGNCNAACQLRWRNLRPYSLPFDWIGMPDPVKTFTYLADGFGNRFRDFCLKENLKPWAYDAHIPMDGLAKYLYVDSLTGWIFVHHFNRPIEEPGAYEEVYRKFRARIDRLYALMDAAHRILFVVSTGKTFDPRPCDALYEKLVSMFPGKEINLRVMQFSAPEEKEEAGRWGVDGGLCLHRRPANRYDFQRTNFEWAFMDELKVAGRPKKPFGLDRVRWKIWKHLGRVLRGKGYPAGNWRG